MCVEGVYLSSYVRRHAPCVRGSCGQSTCLCRSPGNRTGRKLVPRNEMRP